MNFIKTKLEIIIGFVALIFSFGTFKEEFASVKLDLIYIHITLAQYLLGIICGFTICIWLNVMASVASGTVDGQSKLFDHFLMIAHKLFIALLYSPFALIINLYLNRYDHASLNNRAFSIFVGIVSTLIAGFAVKIFVSAFILEFNPIPGFERMVRGLQKRDINKIEPLVKFSMYGDYHFFAEGCLKIIKKNLLFRLKQMNIQASKSKTPFIIRAAWKAGILNANDLIIIRQVWKTSNHHAKGDKINKENIHHAIEYLRQFIVKGYNSATNEQFERA